MPGDKSSAPRTGDGHDYGRIQSCIFAIYGQKRAMWNAVNLVALFKQASAFNN